MYMYAGIRDEADALLDGGEGEGGGPATRKGDGARRRLRLSHGLRLGRIPEGRELLVHATATIKDGAWLR